MRHRAAPVNVDMMVIIYHLWAMPMTKAERWSRTHETLRLSAAKLLRERGLSMPSVADVMKGAKLTVGGFYGHWESKEALFDEVLRDAFRVMRGRLLEELPGDDPRARLTQALRRYLSRAHRDHVTSGCPMPSAVSDVAVLGEPYRTTLTTELDALAAELGEVAGPLGGKQLALGLIALMVGGLTLARATQGTPLSDTILEASRAVGYAALEGVERTSR